MLIVAPDSRISRRPYWQSCAAALAGTSVRWEKPGADDYSLILLCIEHLERSALVRLGMLRGLFVLLLGSGSSVPWAYAGPIRGGIAADCDGNVPRARPAFAPAVSARRSSPFVELKPKGKVRLVEAAPCERYDLWGVRIGVEDTRRIMRRRERASRLEGRVFTVPNALSLARLFMVPIVVALLLARADGLAAALFVLAALTDFLDGRLARLSGPTRLGQILDPVADRLMLSSVAVVLAVRGLLPAWVVAILVGRDLAMLVGSAVVGTKVRVNRVGKAATAVLMVAIALVVLLPGSAAGEFMFFAGFGLSVVAGLMYLRGARRIPSGGEGR